MRKITFTRQELYDLVWSEPLITLSKKYCISDNGLRKICKRMNIPLPNIGHWQRVQYKKRVTTKKLPTNNTDKNTIELTRRDEDDPFIKTNLSPLGILKREIENTPGLNLEVPLILTKPDQLIIKAKKNLADKRPSKYDFHKGIIKTDSGHINITVSPENKGRALRIMDTIIKLLRARKMVKSQLKIIFQ